MLSCSLDLYLALGHMHCIMITGVRAGDAIYIRTLVCRDSYRGGGGGGGGEGGLPPLSKIPPPPFESAQVLK